MSSTNVNSSIQDKPNTCRRVKSCPNCQKKIPTASKKCSCGWKKKEVTNDEAYDPHKAHPRTKIQAKAYHEAGNPLGTHTRVGDVTTEKTLKKRLVQFPNQGLEIRDGSLYCCACQKSVTSAKGNLGQHLANKKHIRNLNRLMN